MLYEAILPNRQKSKMFRTLREARDWVSGHVRWSIWRHRPGVADCELVAKSK